MNPVSGNILNENGQIVNLVDLLGGGTPVSDILYDVSQYAPRSGNILRSDGTLVNLVNLLGGGTPVDARQYDLAQFAPCSGLILGSDGRAYDLAALIAAYGGKPIPSIAYLAQYALTGDPNAPVPATLADLSGNGNDLTPRGFSAYDARGGLTTTGAESLLLPALNVDGATVCKLRVAFSGLTGSARNQRVFNTVDNRFLMFIAESIDPALAADGDTGSYFGYKLEWYDGETKMQHHIADVLAAPGYTHGNTVVELTLNGSNAHVSLTSHGYMGATAKTTTAERDLFIHSASSLLNGFYLLNRADGTRGMSVTLTDVAVIRG